jgi:hypothetical protein
MPKSFASELRGEWSELSRSDSACAIIPELN